MNTAKKVRVTITGPLELLTWGAGAARLFLQDVGQSGKRKTFYRNNPHLDNGGVRARGAYAVVGFTRAGYLSVATKWED